MQETDVWARSIPVEILSHIFFLLPLSDLLAVLLVCRRWLEIGEHPAYWKEITLDISTNNIKNLTKILDIKRLSSIQFDSDCQISEDNLKQITLSNIISLSTCCNDLSHVSQIQLTDCIYSMEKVNMNNTILEDEQLISIFAVPTENHMNLTELCMSNQDLSNIPIRTISTTLCRLKTADIYDTQLTEPQLLCFFTEMSKDTNLVFLNISFSNLSAVPPAILAKSINKLQKVNLMCTKLTSDQTKEIFSMMCVHTRLAELNMHGNHLTEVPPGAISTAVIRLRSVDMSETDLTEDQLIAMFKHSDTGHELEKLDVKYNEAVLELSEKIIRDAEKNSRNLFYTRYFT